MNNREDTKIKKELFLSLKKFLIDRGIKPSCPGFTYIADLILFNYKTPQLGFRYKPLTYYYKNSTYTNTVPYTSYKSAIYRAIDAIPKAFNKYQFSGMDLIEKLINDFEYSLNSN